ncbi:PfkB family carbohydrate kinase, partial [Salmonella enterica subsp. enterica serovar Anatum]|nr:PfkB family carbohydrate kinase [Salmonella enterica subsp. enterica serovar Anatum]
GRRVPGFSVEAVDTIAAGDTFNGAFITAILEETPLPEAIRFAIGADGEVMHSLHADKSGTVTVNLLKTSPTNKKLSLAYNAQS